MHKVSIVILNYNNAPDTIRCLETVLALDYPHFSVIVVDNHSRVEDREALEKALIQHPDIAFIENPVNSGYAGGNNVGIRHALEHSADYILILNNDTEVEPNVLNELIRKAKTDQRIGIVGPVIDEGGRTAYGGTITWLKGELAHNYNPISNEPDFLTGACLLIKKEVFKKIGLLDERYFLYFEDADFCLRARKTGYHLALAENAKIRHYVSASSAKEGSAWLFYIHARNSLLFNWLHAPFIQKMILPLWSVYRIVKQLLKLIMLPGKRATAKAIILGIFDFYRGNFGPPSLKLWRASKPNMIHVGIDCETLEDGQHGVAKILTKILEEIDQRPELADEFRFHLYFKSKIPDLPYLKNPIFEKKIIGPAASFSLYYYVWLPIRLWFEKIDVMYFPNYMLPIIFRGKSLVDLTEDAYYEAWYGQNPFRYKLAYRIFCWWAAKFATTIETMSQTSKREVARLYKIPESKIVANYHGIDLSPRAGIALVKENFILSFGQAFPRRHVRELMLAFEKIAPAFPGLKLIAAGKDKYSPPILDTLAQEINERLKDERIIRTDFIEQRELESLLQKARASVYVSDVEAFGLPSLEALYYGTVPVVAKTDVTQELFGDKAFFVNDPKNIDEFAQALLSALTDTTKQKEILEAAPELVKKYTWSAHTDRWLDIVRNVAKHDA